MNHNSLAEPGHSTKPVRGGRCSMAATIAQ